MIRPGGRRAGEEPADVPTGEGRLCRHHTLGSKGQAAVAGTPLDLDVAGVRRRAAAGEGTLAGAQQVIEGLAGILATACVDPATPYNAMQGHTAPPGEGRRAQPGERAGPVLEAALRWPAGQQGAGASAR